MRRTLAIAVVMTAFAAAAPSAWGSAPSGSSRDRTPDSYTAVTITPIPRSTFPFHGSDGKYHIAYDVVGYS